MDYSIKIDSFEGPFDLLLHLIKEKGIDIYDISIDEITKDYLDYIKKMEELNINVASSYLVMAAELMEIKSKSLLPNNDSVDNIDDNSNIEEGSREDLIERLVLYKKYMEVTDVFRKLENSRNDIFVKSPENVCNYFTNNVYDDKEDVDKLVLAMQQFLERKKLDKPLKTKITNKEYSVLESKSKIMKLLKVRNKVLFNELFEEYSKGYIAVTFLSILELAKEKEVRIVQEHNFDNILIEGVNL